MKNKQILMVNPKMASLLRKTEYLEMKDIKDNEGILVTDKDIIVELKNAYEKYGKEKLLKALRGMENEKTKIVEEHYF